MRAPLYEAVLQRLVPHASYPPTFTSWEEESELDEDAFGRLRCGAAPRLGCVGVGGRCWSAVLNHLPAGCLLA